MAGVPTKLTNDHVCCNATPLGAIGLKHILVIGWVKLITAGKPWDLGRREFGSRPIGVP